jgi:hypothetical protein
MQWSVGELRVTVRRITYVEAAIDDPRKEEDEHEEKRVHQMDGRVPIRVAKFVLN